MSLKQCGDTKSRSNKHTRAIEQKSEFQQSCPGNLPKQVSQSQYYLTNVFIFGSQLEIALYYELLRGASELLANARKYILKVADLTGISTETCFVYKACPCEDKKTLG
jgi:hypothetical protein